MIVTYYSLTTGVFQPGVMHLPNQAAVAANTPPGHAAMAGAHDRRRRRVDVATGAVVDYQPPAPEPDGLRTWTWDAVAWRWVPVPTTAALAAEVRAERGRRLTASDWAVTRATELGGPVPAVWSAYRAALRAMPEQPGFPASVQWPEPPSA